MPKRIVDREQFFTPPEFALWCIEAVDKRFDLGSFSLIVEPSAGFGSFTNSLPSNVLISLDIEPKTPGTKLADFLSWRCPESSGRILVIGNPPFGQRGALAVKFMARACEFADVVSFILPRSFNKYTFQDRVHRNFHLVYTVDSDVEFNRPGTDIKKGVKTVFQIWERRECLREKPERRSGHPHFQMKHAHLSRTSPELLRALCREYDFAIAQVGSDFRPKECEALSRGSYWFIKERVPSVREHFECLDFSFLANMNTAHTSLSKIDIVAAYEAVAATPRGAGDRLTTPGTEETLF